MRRTSKMSWVIFIFVVLIMHGNGDTLGEVVTTPMKKGEQEALYVAIQGFVGNWWNGFDLYPDPCGWTPIQGVSCDLIDGFWYVTNLNIGPLQDNSLDCGQNPEFRPQIFELSHLKSLSLFDCFTSNTNMVDLATDNWLKFAASLESLEFRLNPSLIGPIPFVFGNFRNLKSLVLIENGFTGSLPSSLGNLGQLKRLVISGNKCSGRIPDSFRNLTELLILDLSRNSLSGYLPTSIGCLKSLLKLDLGNNMLKGTIPKEIDNLKNLTLLDLRNNNFSGGLIRSLEEMDSLQELILSTNPIGGDIRYVDWQKMHNLVILDLSNLGLTGEVPRSMTKLKKLRYVELSNNFLTRNLPRELPNMLCVTTFYVNGNNLTGELNFPEEFYGRLGRRFGAWNNTHLCYPSKLMLSGHAPVGVEPCKPKFHDFPMLDIGLHDGFASQQRQRQRRQPNMDPARANAKGEYVISSLGMSNRKIVVFWWVLLVEIFIIVLLSNY